MLNVNEINRALARILPTVQKPGRYTGGEYNQLIKDWDATPLHTALAFPDIYDLAMSNLGMTILLDVINRQPDMLAERVFSPWIDMERALRDNAVPLYSLESKRPVADFDLLGISLPYETLYTNALNLLDLAGIPLRTADRDESYPLVIAGGHATFNPEPMAPLIDAFVIGEGEEAILEVARAVHAWKGSGEPKAALLEQLAHIHGVYVPSLFHVVYKDDGTIHSVLPAVEGIPVRVLKRIVGRLPAPPQRLLVPHIDITHNRVPIEIMRGCTRGCRFCHAGMVNRPVRERPVEEILDTMDHLLTQTGYEEVGLLSLSSSDYTHMLELIQGVNERFAGRHVNISLPSLRIESFSVELMDLLKQNSTRGGFTLAPEAATERMRGIINKPVTTEQLLTTADAIFSRGWHTIKLYFMIGHPEETLEDVQAIADLCKQVLSIGRERIGKRARVHAGVSTFVPKPHTPFQWVSADTIEMIEAKQTLLRTSLRGNGLKLTWTDPHETLLEALLSRGDRRIAEVVQRAWEMGARFDAWREHFDFQRWQTACDQTGIDLHFYIHRQRQEDEVFPWEHIDIAVKKTFLLEDYRMSKKGEVRPDCREHCYACGILPTFTQLRRENPGPVWTCPEIASRESR